MREDKYNVCLIHNADPRGLRVGGTETYLRDYITYHPQDMNLLLIGPDEIGDLPLNQISRVTFRGREFDFLPIYKISDSRNAYRPSIFSSDTFELASLLVKNWSMIRRLLRVGKYSVELRRVEFGPIVWSFGVPYVQMEHVLADKGAPKSGALNKYPYIGTIFEFISAALCKRFYLVNPNMTSLFKKRFWPFAKKFDTLTTWANPDIFRPSQFLESKKLKLVFAGRTDDFKRLDIMLSVIAELERMSPGLVEFHYVGDGDLGRYVEYQSVRGLTVNHGRQTAQQVAEIHKEMHIGLLTSAFEGMPRFVMEALSAGRPVVAIHLPQLEAVITDGVNGFLVPRGEAQVQEMAVRILETYRLILDKKITPTGVSDHVAAYSPQNLLSKIFKDHRELHGLME